MMKALLIIGFTILVGIGLISSAEYIAGTVAPNAYADWLLAQKQKDDHR